MLENVNIPSRGDTLKSCGRQLMEHRPEDYGEDLGRLCELTTMHRALNLVHLQSPPPARCKCLGCTVFTSCFSREQILMEREG